MFVLLLDSHDDEIDKLSNMKKTMNIMKTILSGEVRRLEIISRITTLYICASKL